MIMKLNKYTTVILHVAFYSISVCRQDPHGSDVHQQVVVVSRADRDSPGRPAPRSCPLQTQQTYSLSEELDRWQQQHASNCKCPCGDATHGGNSEWMLSWFVSLVVLCAVMLLLFSCLLARQYCLVIKLARQHCFSHLISHTTLF